MKHSVKLPFILALSISSVVSSADLYWGGNSSGNFQDLGNWWRDNGQEQAATSLPSASDVIYLNAGNFNLGALLQTFSGEVSVQGLRWNANLAEPHTLGLTTDTLVVGSSGIMLQNNGSELRLQSKLKLDVAQTWTNNSSNNFVVEGVTALATNLNLAGSGAYDLLGMLQVSGNRVVSVGPETQAKFSAIDVTSSTLTIDTQSSVPTEIRGLITGAGGNFEKNGAGLLIIHDSLSYGGNLRIRDGEIELRKSNATSSQLIFGAASGAMGSDGYGTLSLARSDTQRVAHQLGGNTYVHATSDGAWIRAVGSGAIDPLLAMGGERIFIIRPQADMNEVRLQIDVELANHGATVGALTKRGAGTMLVTGINTYTGNTNVDRGRLILDYSTNNGDNKMSNTGALNLRGGTLILKGNSQEATSERVGSMAVGVGINTLNLNSIGGKDLSLIVQGNLTRTANTGSVGGGITTSNANGILNLVTAQPDKARLGVVGTGLQNNAAGFIGGWFVFNGDRWAARNGDWIEAFDGGVLQQDLGQWQVSDNIILENSGTGTMKTTSVQSLILDATQQTTFNINNQASVLTLQQGALLVSADTVGATEISGGQLMSYNTTHGAIREMSVTNLSNQQLTISTNFGSSNTFLSSTQNVLFSGKGTIQLLGSNWSMGSPTALSVGIGGHVKVGSATALGSYGAVVLGGGHDTSANGALLDLAGGRLVMGRLSGGRGGDIAYGELGPGEVALGTNGHLTLNQVADSSFAGQLSGTGTILKKGAGSLSLTNHTSTYSGQIVVAGGALNLAGTAPTLNAVSSIVLRGGSISSYQASSTGSVDHLRNAATIFMQGTSGDGLKVFGNTNTSTSETIQGLKLEGGHNVISMVNTHAAPTAAVNILSLAGGANTTTRDQKSTLLVRGMNLGGDPAVGAAATRITFTTLSNINSALIGGNATTAGSTTLSILPYAVGESSTTSTAALLAVGDSFLTYGAGGTGLRVLTAAEYATFAAAGAQSNVSMSGTLTGQSAKTFNSLRVVSSAGNAQLTGTGSLEITSGALLFSAGATTNESVISYDTLTSGSAAKELVVFVTSSHTNAAAAKATIEASITNNGANAVSLTKSGDGLLVLQGNNTYTGETTVNAGTLEFGTGTAGNLGSGLLRMAGGTLRWGLNNTTDITANGRVVSLIGASAYITPGYGGNLLNSGSVFDVGANHVTLAGAVGNGGYGGLTKLGSGTLTFQSALNFTGATVIKQGRVDFNGGINANTTEALYLVRNTEGTGQIIANVDGNLNVQSLVVGGAYGNAGATTAILTVKNGAVNIVDSSGFVQIGIRDITAAGGNSVNSVSTADFTLATGVNIQTGQLEVGVYKGTQGTAGLAGSLLLSNGQNHINAGSIIVGTTPSSFANTAVTSTLVMGNSQNRFETDTLVIGGARSVASATIRANGSFILRGQQGGNTGANLFIGDNDMVETGVVTVGTFDLSGASSVDATVNLMILGRIGKSNGNGAGKGTLRFDTGEIRATTIQMAEPNYSSPTTTSSIAANQGTIQQRGSATLRYQTLSTANPTTTTTSGVALSTSVALHDFQSGTLKNLDGDNLRNLNVTVALNQHLSQNVLDTSIRKVEVTANQTATFEADAEFTGAGSFLKTGTGTLVLRGTNLNTGNVRISQGTLALSQQGNMSDAAWFNLESSGSFAIRDRVSGAYSMDSTISGTGMIDATGGRLTVASNQGAVQTHGVLKPGSSSQLVSSASANTVGDQTGTLSVTGNLTLLGFTNKITRAQLQVGATVRNILSTRPNYVDAATWVNDLPNQSPSMLVDASNQHDLLKISGNLTLNSNAQIEVVSYQGYTGVEGDVFNLLDWGTITVNDFVVGNRYQSGLETGNDLKLFALNGDLKWDTHLFLSHGALVIVAIPEPTYVALLSWGLAALTLRRRRR